MKHVFVASIATETNTFSPLRTDFTNFEECFYAMPGEHPATPTLCSAVFTVLREYKNRQEIRLTEGTACWAEPGGLINANTWNRLRDEMLCQLKNAGPVDVVILGLHGAMIAENARDPEGELIAAVRDLVGPDVVIGVTFDPHSHLSDRRVKNTDIITVFKEFPHTDFVETAQDCVRLSLATSRHEIDPQMAVYDAKLIDVMPTSRQPMRGYVDDMKRAETSGKLLSISTVHGFMAGDSPDLGAKVIVIADKDMNLAVSQACAFGKKLFSFRGKTMSELISVSDIYPEAQKYLSDKPVVIADIWDNPGGGVAGDSTHLLRKALKLGIKDIAFGTIWDPMAVKLCFAAGEGASMPLRFGGKTAAGGGWPVDALVKVKRVKREAYQSFGRSYVPLGDCAVISFQGIEVVLNSNRAQSFSPNLFTNLGIDMDSVRILVIKSTNHFYHAFEPIAGKILYAAVMGVYPSDPATNDYRHIKRQIWPIVRDPYV